MRKKPFYRLSWPFLFHTLACVEVKGPFLRAIETLYSNPAAAVRLPHAVSSIFHILNGIRQGCPLSPLLFALCIEPLAATISSCPDIFGVNIRSKEFKISLYADDVLFGLLRTGIKWFSLMNVIPSVLFHANSKTSWHHSCLGLLINQGNFA